MPYREFRVSVTVRCGMAHDRNRRCFWRGGRISPIARPLRSTGCLRAWSCGDSAGRIARNVRLDDQEFSSRTCRAEWIDSRVAGLEKFHELRTKPGSEVWLGKRRERSSQLRRHHKKIGRIIRNFKE